MALTLQQKVDLLHDCNQLRYGFRNDREVLAHLNEMRDAYGDDVVVFLADIITPTEWTQVNASLATWEAMLATRIDAKLGVGLDALRPAPELPEPLADPGGAGLA